MAVSAPGVRHEAFPSLQEAGKEKSKNCAVSLTFLVQAEVLQGLVEVPGCGDRADVPVGADGAQPRCARTISHRCQTATLCGRTV